MIWLIPQSETIGFKVPVISDPDLFPNCCEYNCDNYIARLGGDKVEGVYVLKHNKLGLYQLVRHFLVHDGNDYVDITPFEDGRTHNWFIPMKINSYNTFVRSLEYISERKIQENTTLYYVYCYIDSDTNIPIYVGRGKTNRARVRVEHNKEKRKIKNKQHRIAILAQNIEDERVALEIEESYIKQYGRICHDGEGTYVGNSSTNQMLNTSTKTRLQHLVC